MWFWMCIGLVSNNSSHLIWALHKYSNKWEDFYCSFNSTQSTVYITTENRTRTWETQSWRFPKSVGSVQTLTEKYPGWVGMGWDEIKLSTVLWRCCCLWGVKSLSLRLWREPGLFLKLHVEKSSFFSQLPTSHSGSKTYFWAPLLLHVHVTVQKEGDSESLWWCLLC